jgi:hypothetical protein
VGVLQAARPSTESASSFIAESLRYIGGMGL